MVAAVWCQCFCTRDDILIILGSSLISDFSLTIVFDNNGCYRATTRAVVFHWISLYHLVSQFCRRLFPQNNYGETRKVFLIRLAAKKAIQNHCTKMTIGRIHGEGTRAVSLTRQIAFWNKTGPPDLYAAWRLSYEDLCHSYDFVHAVITLSVATNLLNPPSYNLNK